MMKWISMIKNACLKWYYDPTRTKVICEWMIVAWVKRDAVDYEYNHAWNQPKQTTY